MGQYSYYPWDVQGGRLQGLKASKPGDPTALLDFTYSYDPVGNLSSIVDARAGGTQTQSFGYDALDRLTSAQAAGGTQGVYGPEQYTYQAETGNLNSKAGVEYTYDPSRPHAVASTTNGNSYQYDANGNQIQRNIGSLSYTLEYDAENRLTAVRQGTTTIAAFVYDGDGRRVKGTLNGVTTTYIGNLSEWTGSASTLVRYYYADGVRVAMKRGGTVYYLIGDHLGSTSVVATSSGGLQGKQLYKAWEEPRYASASLPTAYTYTGQYSYMDDLATPGTSEGFGLMFYNARWYDPMLGRWNQPDTVVPYPENPTSWDRYAYVRNNPVNWSDPTGHAETCGDPGMCEGGFDPLTILTHYSNPEWIDAALRNYARAYPNYSPYADDRLQNNPNFDPQAAIFLIGNAQFQVTAERAQKGEGDPWQALGFGAGMTVMGAVLGGGHNSPQGGVYSLTNPSGKVVRVGRTNNLFRREKEYWRDPNYFDLKFKPEYYTDNYGAQRGLEQLIFDEHYPPLNTNRPISPTNVNRIGYLQAAMQFLSDLISGK